MSMTEELREVFCKMGVKTIEKASDGKYIGILDDEAAKEITSDIVSDKRLEVPCSFDMKDTFAGYLVSTVAYMNNDKLAHKISYNKHGVEFMRIEIEPKPMVHFYDPELCIMFLLFFTSTCGNTFECAEIHTA